MRIIVTGGAGFLGHHLCRALAKAGHQVKVIDLKVNPEFETIVADIQDKEKMLTHVAEADLVFHLASLIEAGESVKFPQRFIDVNISGTVNILEAMKQNHVPSIIFSSSAAVYGEPQHVPIDEDSRTIPINPYGMTKLAMEALISSYVATGGLTGVALRYFNLYGPEELHEPETHAIPRFIKQINEGQEVTVWGDGSIERDYIHIQDIVDAHLAAMELAGQQPNTYHYFNISTEKPTAVIDVVRLVEKYIGKPALIKNFPPRPGDPQVLVASAAKARREMGWEAKVELEAGIKETVEWFLTRQG